MNWTARIGCLLAATFLAGIPGYADVAPPPGPPITLKVSAEGAKFVMRGLAIAGLDARLECFYSYSSDGRPSDPRARCEADRVVQSFLSKLKGRADVSIVENNRYDDCKKIQN